MACSSSVIVAFPSQLRLLLWVVKQASDVQSRIGGYAGEGKLRRASSLAGSAFAIALLIAAPAQAEGSSKGHGEGGRFAVYYPIIAKYNKSGGVFRVEGVCRSACTLFLGIRNVCVDRKATLAFHGGPDSKTHKVGPDTSSSRSMLAAYKSKLKRYLLDGHHLDSSNYHELSGAVLIDTFGYPACKPR
jgi:hypothetical protein